MNIIKSWQVIKLGEDTYAAHGILIEGPRCEDESLVRESDYDTLAEQLQGTVGAIERAIQAADWEPGDAQRALQELRDWHAKRVQ